jgi:hypothetical protein
MRTRQNVLWSLFLCVSSCAAFSGGAEHPKPGEPSKAEYCASGPSEEQNCMACASKAGCGFCKNPKAGAHVCQPGTSTQTESASCSSELLVSNEDCDAPPPAEASY